MNAVMKSIYLVNPISGRGHLDSYARLYSRALLELGYMVVLVAETDGDTLAYLERNCSGLRQSFSFAPFEEPRRSGQLSGMAVIAHTVRRVWRDEGIPGLLVRCARVPRRFYCHMHPNAFRTRSSGSNARLLVACWVAASVNG